MATKLKKGVALTFKSPFYAIIDPRGRVAHDGLKLLIYRTRKEARDSGNLEPGESIARLSLTGEVVQ